MLKISWIEKVSNNDHERKKNFSHDVLEGITTMAEVSVMVVVSTKDNHDCWNEQISICKW